MAAAPTPSFAWASDPRVSSLLKPFTSQSPFKTDSMFGSAIAAARKFSIGPGTTGYGHDFGAGIIDTSIPEFNVPEPEGEGEGDGGGDQRQGGYIDPGRGDWPSNDFGPQGSSDVFGRRDPGDWIGPAFEPGEL